MMNRFNGLAFEQYRPDFSEKVYEIAKRAFSTDFTLYFPEAYKTKDKSTQDDILQSVLTDNKNDVFVITCDNEVIGCIVVRKYDESVVCLRSLFIDPHFQRKGYGGTAWDFIESKYPEIVYWQSELPVTSGGNHVFFLNRCGFQIVKVLDPSEFNERFLLRKQMIYFEE